MEQQLKLNSVEKPYNFKEFKKILIELGFHHCWGRWLYPGNKNYEIIFGRNGTTINMRKDTYYFDLKDTIHVRENKKFKSMKEIESKVKKYFNI